MNSFYFPADCYSTALGSFALCQALLNNKLQTDKDKQHFKTLFFRAKKRKWDMKDPDLLKKISKFFECEYIIKNIAMVVSSFNLLFSFYVENEDGTITILPLREDGYLPITLKQGKIYILKENENVLEQINK